MAVQAARTQKRLVENVGAGALAQHADAVVCAGGAARAQNVRVFGQGHRGARGGRREAGLNVCGDVDEGLVVGSALEGRVGQERRDDAEDLRAGVR